MHTIENLQLNSQGKLQHFLSIEGLDKSLLTEILDTAESFAYISEQQVKKFPIITRQDHRQFVL